MSDFPRPDRARGVFETMLVLDGVPIELEAHLERLGRSVGELFTTDLPANTQELVRDGASTLALGRLRLTITPAQDGAVSADVLTASVAPENVFPTWEHAIALRPLLVEGGLGEHKWADRDGLAAAESSAPEGSLPLLLDAGGEVLEASRANVFAVEESALITPATDGRILPGVTRTRTLEMARSLGIEVREQALSIERLIAAGAGFLTGSVRGIEPIRAVGEAELEAPGEAVSELAAEMKRAWTGASPAGLGR